MEVGRWMTRTPVLVGSNENLAAVRQKMEQGSFHRVPVVDNGKLVGIVCDSDLRQHAGALEKVKVNGTMTRPVVTVTPTTMLERAANLLVRHKIGGLPVVEQGTVVGIITATDLPAARLHRGPWRRPGRGLANRPVPGRFLRSFRWSCNWWPRRAAKFSE